MIKNNLNIQEIFSEAWVKTKKNYWFLFCLFVVSTIIIGLTQHTELLAFIVSIPIGIATLTIAILIANGHIPKYSDLFKSFDNYKITLNYILASTLFMIIVLLGLLALIIPGIYLAIRLQFYKFLVIENENMRPIETLKESMRMTKGHFWDLLGFVIVILVMNLIGAIPFGLGLIITVPLTIVASALLYKKLLPHHTHHQTHTV